MNKKQKNELIKKLRPYWKECDKIRIRHWREITKLEEKMNKELKLKIPLEFFHVEGEIVGIGAEDWNDRKHFPLIHDNELD